MVRQIGIHEKHEVTRNQLQAINVCAPKTKLPGALQDLEVPCAKDALQLNSDLVRAVRAAVFYDDDLIVQLAAIGEAGCVAPASHHA